MGMTTTPALHDVIVERQKQISKGYNALHDDGHKSGELAAAALAYLLDKQGGAKRWPFEAGAFKPSDDRRENLVVAAAFLIAEIERLDRIKIRNAIIEQIARAISEQPTGDLDSSWIRKAEAALAILEVTAARHDF